MKIAIVIDSLRERMENVEQLADAQNHGFLKVERESRSGFACGLQMAEQGTL